MTNDDISWDTYKLGQLLNRVIGGGTPARNVKKYWDGDLPWASVKDFQDEKSILEDTEEHISISGLNNSSASLIEPNVIVICTRMAVGRAAITTRKIAINQDLKALYTNDLLEPRYLLYVLQHKRHLLEAVAVGSTVKGITLDQLLDLSLCTPSRNEQRNIVNILDAMDEAIQKAEQVISKHKNIRAGLLHDLLTYGLDANGEPNYSRSLGTTQYGNIPVDWQVSNLGDIAEIGSGLTLGRNLDGQTTIELPYLRVWNVQDGYIDLSDVKTIKIPPEEITRYRLEVGDVLMTEGGDFDKLK